MNNLYFVESPLQLLSAIDVKNVLGAAKDTHTLVVVKRNDQSANDEQIEQLIDRQMWDEVIELHFFNSTGLNLIYACYLMVFFYLKFRCTDISTFIGEFRNNYFNLLSHILTPTKDILLDDGNVTVYLQQQYFRKGINFERYLYESGSPFKYLFRFAKSIFSFKSKPTPDVYSFFDVTAFLFKEQKNLKKGLPALTKPLTQDIYFIGAKFSENGIISLYTEIELLSTIREHLNGLSNTIYYLPHRDDSPEKLKEIEGLGFIVKNLGKPIEVYFQEQQEIPAIIASFCSTALYTLTASYSLERAISFDLSNYITDEALNQEFSCIYEYYKTLKTIDVIEI